MPRGEGLEKDNPEPFTYKGIVVMDNNGFQGQMPQQPAQAATQQPQAPQQPQVNQQPVQPQPTPQFNILPANPNGPTVQQQPPQQPAQTNQQAAEIAQLRQQIATGLGVQVDQVPSDIPSLAKIVQGGWYAAQKMEQLQKQPPVPAPQPQPQAQPQDRLSPRPMDAGWERMVQKDQNGVYQPVHPNFASVAADANYNEGVYAARSMAINQGQFLPEQQKSVKDVVAQELAREREALRAEMFMEANESKLFVMNQDGTRKMEVQPDGSLQPARTEIGLEMIKAAQEVLQEGAQFASQHDLAKYALKVAEGRIRMKQQHSQQQQQDQQHQTPPAYNDLSALLNGHRQSGNAGGGNINTLPAQTTNDLRTNMRAILKGAPQNGNGMDMLNFIRGR